MNVYTSNAYIQRENIVVMKGRLKIIFICLSNKHDKSLIRDNNRHRKMVGKMYVDEALCCQASN